MPVSSVSKVTPGCLLDAAPRSPLPTHTAHTHAHFLLCLLRAAPGFVHRHFARCLPFPAAPAQLLLPGTVTDVPGSGGTSQKAIQALFRSLASIAIPGLCFFSECCVPHSLPSALTVPAPPRSSTNISRWVSDVPPLQSSRAVETAGG